jgi:TetR/AcrR family transcriptional regulator
MFEGLIDFIEETLFTRITRIIAEPEPALAQCEKIVVLVLGFAEKNPGISRVLNGDALAGEHERLRVRVSQIFDRLETQIRQILREAEVKEGLRTTVTGTSTAGLLLAFMEGKISQYVRTDFKQVPTSNLQEQFALLSRGIFRQPQ